uniref:Protein S100 n=1 Tax=Labrus bergylta TaxID=56723 RepID=A0A3Q3EI51_9LABR
LSLPLFFSFTLITTFHHYAVQDGDGKTLTVYISNFDFTSFSFLPILFQAQNNPKLVDCIMKDLDLNKDDKLDFEEFLPLIAGLSLACEKMYNLHQKKGKK